jgi:hypothetical protein
MTTVCWTPSEKLVEASILFEEPKLLSKELAERYRGYEFFTCPAFQGLCKNTFVITAPMSGTIKVSKGSGDTTMNIDGYGWDQPLYNAYCRVRLDGTVSLPPNYIFYAKESLEMEVLPVFLLDSPSLENAMFMPASYDIGKWIRPVDFSFIPKDITKPIVINRGDPLFFIRFKPKDGERVVLERVEYTQEVQNTIGACVNMKLRLKNMTLPELYKLAKSHIQLFLKGRKNI